MRPVRRIRRGWDLVERVIADLDRLTRWTLTPPIVPLRWVGEKLRTDT